MAELKTGRRLASRRFILTMLVLIATTILVATSKIESTAFESIVIWLTGIYVVGKPVGDVTAHFTNKKLAT